MFSAGVALVSLAGRFYAVDVWLSVRARSSALTRVSGRRVSRVLMTISRLETATPPWRGRRVQAGDCESPACEPVAYHRHIWKAGEPGKSAICREYKNQ